MKLNLKINDVVRNTVLLLVIMALAAFLRFYRLDALPPGLWLDVAINGNDALNSQQTGDYMIFYPENNGREGLMIWLDAFSMSVFGITPVALKIPAAIIGTLTVWGVYLLAKQLFARQKQGIALLAAFFCAISFWHVDFSRIGFRAILVPFCLVFTFYFLWRAFDKKTMPPTFAGTCGRTLYAIASGVFFGLGFYSYTAFRLAVFPLFCVLALWLILFWRRKNQFIKIAVPMLLAAYFTALPIGLYFVRHPADFFAHAAQLSVISAPSPFAEFGVSLILHLGMFNFAGDRELRHNLPGAPELFFPVGILFLAGLWVIIARTIKQLKQKKYDYEFISYSLLLLWFIFLLLPGVLTREYVPHSLRTIGVIPSVMIIVALGAIAVYDWVKTRLFKSNIIAIGALFFLACASHCYYQYFVTWGGDPNLGSKFMAEYVAMGRLTSELHSAGYQTVVVANVEGVPVPYPDGIPMASQTVQFTETADCYQAAEKPDKMACRPYSRFILLKQIDKIDTKSKTAIVPMADIQIVFDWLKELYPHGEIKIRNGIRYFEINS